jgi:hypothetical protein
MNSTGEKKKVFNAGDTCHIALVGVKWLFVTLTT